VFLVPVFKVPPCLLYVTWLAAVTLHLIYATFVVLSILGIFGCRWFCIVLFVLYVILMLVFLNSLAMVLVPLPMYVNVAHFCFGIMFGVLLVFGFVFMFWYA
jgi:hypothetical protein